MPVRSADQLLALAVRPLGILLFECRDRRHAAVLLLAAQPAEKGALEQPDIQPIGLRPPVLARHRDARRMNDVSFDPAGAQPARQPEAVAAGLKGDDDARDLVAGLDGFVAPAMQQLEATPPRPARASSADARSMPGTIPPTSQLARLSSTTAISVLSCSRATRDLLRSSLAEAWGLHRLFGSDDGAIPSPPAP